MEWNQKHRIIAFWNQRSKDIKEMAFQYPITLIAVIIGTLDAILVNHQTFPTMIDGTKIGYMIGIFAIGACAAETLFQEMGKSKLYQIICMLCCGVFSYAYMFVTMGEETHDIFDHILYVYVIVFFMLSFYRISKNSKKGLSEYTIRVFSNVIQVHIAYLLLIIGVELIITIINVLFFQNTNWTLYADGAILITGLFYIPGCLYSFLRVRDTIEKFVVLIVKYVLLILTVCAFFIIYLYLIKIAISRTIPKNQLYEILSVLFIIGLPIWTMTEAIEPKSIFSKIANILPYAFGPLIVFQTYAVAVRIHAYGITPPRYTGCVLILIEVIYILIHYKWRQHITSLCLILSGLSVIVLLIPGINMFDLTKASQTRRHGANYEEELLQEEEENAANIIWITAGEENTEIDVRGYKSVELVDTEVDDEMVVKLAYGKTKKEEVEVDCSSYIDDMLAQIKDPSSGDQLVEEYVDKNHIMKIDSKQDFYITYVSLNYNVKNGEKESVYIKGVILRR